MALELRSITQKIGSAKVKSIGSKKKVTKRREKRSELGCKICNTKNSLLYHNRLCLEIVRKTLFIHVRCKSFPN